MAANLSPVNIAKPEVFVGGLLGAMLVFLFFSPRDSRGGQGGLLRDQRSQTAVQGKSQYLERNR
mgnify:CR=1 FL=1